MSRLFNNKSGRPHKYMQKNGENFPGNRQLSRNATRRGGRRSQFEVRSGQYRLEALGSKCSVLRTGCLVLRASDQECR